MGEYELLLDAKELTQISVRCLRCHTTIIFSATMPAEYAPDGRCPGCDVPRLVAAFRRFCDLTSGSPREIQFRVHAPAPVDRPTA